MPVKIVDPGIWSEISTDISVSRQNYKFIGFFNVINIVAVLFFGLAEGLRIIYDVACALFVFIGIFVSEILFKFAAVLVEMLIKLRFALTSYR